jgi:hypothetical protein
MEKIIEEAIEQEEVQMENNADSDVEQNDSAMKAQELIDLLSDPEFIRAYKKSRPDIYGRRVVSKEEKKKKKAKRRMAKKSKR